MFIFPQQPSSGPIAYYGSQAINTTGQDKPLKSYHLEGFDSAETDKTNVHATKQHAVHSVATTKKHTAFSKWSTGAKRFVPFRFKK